MLEVSNLIKTYKGSKTPTLKGVSFTVKDGDVFGIIGKNGAGKSTTIKAIIGIHSFEGGEIVVNGYSIKKDENSVKQLIGYVPDNHSVYENLTGREYVNFMADVYGVDKQDREQRLNKYAKMFNLEHAIDNQISGYSHGMRQKICIIGALVHEPKLWVLDEPFLGLDPQSIDAVKECIHYYSKDKSHMVIFTSHNLDTVIEMCNKVCVINNGKVKDIVKIDGEKSKKQLRELME